MTESQTISRNVGSIIQALDAAIAGEIGHIAVNRMLMLHETPTRTEAEAIEYWTLRGRAGTAVDVGRPGKGSYWVGKLLSLHDGLEWSRGVTSDEQIEIRRQNRDLFWTVRSGIAWDIASAGASPPDAST